MQLAISLGLTACVLCFWITPWLRNVFARLDCTDRPDGGRKAHVHAVPRLGGIGIMLAYSVALAIGEYRLRSSPQFRSSPELGFIFQSSILALLVPAILVFAVGLLDDLKGLRAGQKLILQTGAATLVCLSGLRFSWGPPYSEPLAIVLSIAWLVACTNAFNLIDGLDGLASGVGVLMAATMAAAGLLLHHVELTIASMLLCGALLGFLRYNLAPASIFLGDSGSLTIGFMLGCCSILWSNQQHTVTGKLAPVVVFAVPLLDLALSVLRRALRGVPLFSPDRGHIHHRLLARGLSTRRSVLFLCAATLLACSFGLLLSLDSDFVGVMAIGAVVSIVLISIQQLRYAEFGAVASLWRQFSWRRSTSSYIALTNFKQALAVTGGSEEYWKLLKGACREFGFCHIKLVVNGQVYEEDLQDRLLQPALRLTLPLIGMDSLTLSRGMIFGGQPSSFFPFLETIQNDLIERYQERRFMADPFPLGQVQARTLAANQ
jgi:UDP-GlcNAc:undecaprenyl-phosphate GlcNAc-1-phosphate transferase